VRLLAIPIVLCALAGAAAASPGRTVPCQEIIDHPVFPYLGSPDPAYRYREVLGRLSVPPAYMQQTVRVDEGRWRYWSKAGLIVRSGPEPVTVSVPVAWRTRAGITWGNGGNGVMSSLRIAGCGTDASRGNAYAGGFFLHARSACVPLVFSVAGRSATVRFGIGRRC
jgi:hypothetical protein